MCIKEEFLCAREFLCAQKRFLDSMWKGSIIRKGLTLFKSYDVT